MTYIRKFKKGIVFVLLVVIVGGICWAGGMLYTNGKKAEHPELSAVVLQQRLSEINELASVTYAYTNMAQFESSNDFYGMKVPFTTKSFILTYEGVIKAGIDMSLAEVSETGKRIKIILPEAEILSHQIDEDSIEVFDEKRSIFNPFKIEDYNTFRKDQQKKMEEKAMEQGLLEEAQERAEENIRMLFTAAIPEDYKLVVE